MFTKEEIFEKISKKVNLKVIDAYKLAKEAGNSKSVNVVLIGVMAKSTNISYDKWIEVIKQTVKPQFIDSNIKAFDLGYNL